MKSNKQILDAKLDLLRNIQRNYPTLHVGGSIGLFLHGYEPRTLDKSDLDTTVDAFSKDAILRLCAHSTDLYKGSMPSDLDLVFSLHTTLGGVKLDLRICPEPSFEVTKYDGHSYNVSKLRDILYWKKLYAKRGVNKHLEDLRVIAPNEVAEIEEYIKTTKQAKELDLDELPF